MKIKLLITNVLVILFLTSCEKTVEKPETIRPVRAMKLVAEETIQTRVFPGRTRAINRVNLSFRVEGPMNERPMKVGDRVTKGEVLARIDPRDYEVNLQIAEGKLERSQAQLRFAERDYARAVSIWEKDPGAISKSLLDRKKEDVNQFKGEILSLEGDVEAAKDQLSYTKLIAPFDGMITATYVEPFEYVNAKQSILRILNTTKVEMVIDVPESQITEIPNAKEIFVQFDSLPGKKYPAKIIEIGTEASVTTRTFPVTLLIEQKEDGVILSGMAGYAYFFGKKTPDLSEKGYIVPTTSVISDVDKNITYVWLINPDTMRVYLQPVKKGKITERGIMLLGGVKEGDWVVTSGANLIREGQKVTILPITVDEQGRHHEMAD
ncbi:MAG: Multidrug resistance protein MdtA [Chlamydiae bacterium]|nr:Multidrug resistance protein MdtA [Chlamydiota bacterium]